MVLKETPITASWFGVAGKGTCPTCAASLQTTFGASIICKSCGEYLTVANKAFRQIDPNSTNLRPFYAAPTPWADIAAARSTTMTFTLEDYAFDKFMTKNEGVRVWDAKWPGGCCVCGKAKTRDETVVNTFVFTPPGLIRIRDKEAKLIAKGVPYCSEHNNGVEFGRVLFNMDQTGFGLLFRSYAYRNSFRLLNPWKWV